MSRRMLVVMGVVMGAAVSVQGALLNANTLDRLHDGSQWYESSGAGQLWQDTTGSFFWNGSDLNDTEYPQYMLQRSSADPFMFGYRAATGSTLSRLEISTSINGWFDLSQITVSYGSGNDNFTVKPYDTWVYRSEGGWNNCMLYYDLSQANADRVHITLSGGAWWTPLLSSVKVDVVPEPVTVLLLVFGGALVRAKRFGF